MERIRTTEAAALDFDEVLGLYVALGWSAYTGRPEILRQALAGSSLLVEARIGARLVGLARAISDGASICYLQDLLVHPDHQRSGIGRRLAEAVLAHYPLVRQKVLLTDDEPRQQAFYESLGYREIRDFDGGGLRAFIRFD
jgi:ribosomal protein S18 acetylase RimI-like enzyme